MLRSGSDGRLADAAGAGETAELVHGGELTTPRGLKRSGEGDGPAELRRETAGLAACRWGLWTGLCSGLDPEKRDGSVCYRSLSRIQ